MNKIDLIIDALEGMCGDRCNTEYNLCQASVALAAVRELKALKPVGYMDSKGVLFNETTHPHLHTALYPLEVALAQPEPFKPDWVSYRQGVADGAAQPEQEEPLPLVDIGVDVTPGGTHVVACYNRPDAVQEMFYSQFHPLAKPEQEPKLSDAGVDTNIPLWGLEPKGEGMVTLNQVGMRVDLKDGTRKEWVGLTAIDIHVLKMNHDKVKVVYTDHAKDLSVLGQDVDVDGLINAIQNKLKELNT